MISDGFGTLSFEGTWTDLHWSLDSFSGSGAAWASAVLTPLPGQSNGRLLSSYEYTLGKDGKRNAHVSLPNAWRLNQISASNNGGCE